MKKLTFEFDVDGSMTMKVSGYSGSACRAATAPFERVLGAAMRREVTAEARQVQGTVNNQSQKIGAA